MDSDDDSDEPCGLVAADFSEEEEEDEVVEVTKVAQHKVNRSRRSTAKPVDYSKERNDQFFSGVPGYTDFNRTRKGGDVRPNASKTKVSKITYLSRLAKFYLFAWVVAG
jgi:hypothetical protein